MACLFDKVTKRDRESDKEGQRKRGCPGQKSIKDRERKGERGRTIKTKKERGREGEREREREDSERERKGSNFETVDLLN